MQRAATALLAVGIVSLLAPPAPGQTSSDREIYEEGLHSVLQLDWDEASHSFNRLLEQYPDSPYQDDALYWRAFARVEAGDCASAYSVLEELEMKFPSSPRAEAARTLRVRCAGELLLAEPSEDRAKEYSGLIARSARDDSVAARLSAADVLLAARPAEGAEAINRLSRELDDLSLLEVILDRHFGAAKAAARAIDPSMPLGPANSVVLVRREHGLEALGLAEAVAATLDDSRTPYSDQTRAAIRLALGQVRRTLEAPRDGRGEERSRIVQVEDTEIHLYRNGGDVVRILVLDRDQGYRENNVRVFVEREGAITEIPAREAERMAARGDTRLLDERSLTFVGSSLALIQLDLEGATALAGTEGVGLHNLRPADWSPTQGTEGTKGREDGGLR